MSGGRGIILAAPASHHGKTVIALSLLRALRDRGIRVASAKIGPDYIDPAFHTVATGLACLNLDSWAMRPATLRRLIDDLTAHADLILVEGAMGLFDGARQPSDAKNPELTDGSAAALARLTGWPVVLLLDVAGQSTSAAAVLRGFSGFDPDVEIRGAIFNRIGSQRHFASVLDACAAHCRDVEILGGVPKSEILHLPERHLGLVQAGEHDRLPAFIEAAAAIVGTAVDLDRLAALARPAAPSRAPAKASPQIPPPGQTVAVAADPAFSFAYHSVLDRWQSDGAALKPFSPLNNEPPAEDADAVFLPGGYPELHAGRLAGNRAFLDGLHRAAARNAFIFGECGGYMVLGRTLTDAAGNIHPMAGLLPLHTSFATPKLHLGYRHARLTVDLPPLGWRGRTFSAHEFHYAEATRADGRPLFRTEDAAGTDTGGAGLKQGRTAGSFLHLIDCRE